MIRQVSIAFAAIGVAALSQTGPSALPPPGSPLPGISGMEQELFRLGLEDFKEVETVEDGLGPAFNGTSCAMCHSVPAVGGMASITEVRAGYRDEEGKFTELNGGTLYHLFSIPDHRCQVQIPAGANVIARRMAMPLFGAGLVEAIPDESILAREDPDDRNGDGIRGRAARVTDIVTGRERIGRFGWKGQHATLLAFAGDAYRNEMGITNDLFPDEVALGIDPGQMRLCSPRRGVEDVRNRRTGLRGIDNFANFMRLLAPIGRGAVTDQTKAGEALFAETGCAACHTPLLMTGPSANRVFDRQPAPLYSDLLLHDIGTGDGIEQAGAHAMEIRTPSLWGLRLRRPFLHDGSAATIEDAIGRHGNEGEPAVKAFRNLTAVQREQLMAFLQSL